MKYELFLFDADDTLFDFRTSERSAFHETLAAYGMQARWEILYAVYREVSLELWKLFEDGLISKSELRAQRFQQVFAKENLSSDHLQQISEHYMGVISGHAHLRANAVEVCKLLKPVAKIGIVTNGMESVQRSRLMKSELARLIDFLVVSEECGFPKPAPGIFEYSLKKAGHRDKESVLMVGDRLETDIKGGNDFGIDTAWLNWEKAPRTLPISPTYEICDLLELVQW